MDDKHNAIIVQEIEYWKEHKLLPEDRCDFLLALYTQGEASHIEAEQLQQNKRKTLHFVYVFILLCVIPLSFVLTYFTDAHEIFIIVLFVLFISFSWWTYALFAKTMPSFQYIPMIIGLIMILYTTVYVTKVGTASLFAVNCVIFMNFVIWLWIGWKTKLTYVLIMGILAVGFLLSSIIL